MPIDSAFRMSPDYRAASLREVQGVMLPWDFGDAAAEYQLARSGGALFDRSDRGRIRVGGADRRAWLHNLLTQAIKPLAEGEGGYAFAIDVRGRTIFDANVLCLSDEIWLDVARGWIGAALSHLQRYHVSEDVTLADESAVFAQLGVAGPAAQRVAAGLGVAALDALPQLASVPVESGGRLIRHDFSGMIGFELVTRSAAAVDAWQRCRDLGAAPCGLHALDALRIEAGIPWSLRDIDEKVIPPETGQAHRAIHYQKGCYLGQEVIERMRSLGAPAKRLVRVTLTGPVETPTPLRQGDQEVGRLTSLVLRPSQNDYVGLGYLSARVRNLEGISAAGVPVEISLLGEPLA